jgi:phosphoribosylformylglycinamidine synthase
MVDEAVRNAVAVGADPDHLALLDNFCWPDPVYDPVRNPDGPFKLAQLVRTCRGLAEATLAFQAPLISGKDSMKNDYHGPGIKISVPPTLLVSAIARHPDTRRAVTMDVKIAGDNLYVIGVTRAEMGGSQYSRLKSCAGGAVPRVELPVARRRYQALHWAIMQEMVASCHDCSEGGLAVALAEKAIAGGMGLRVDLSRVPAEGQLSLEELLFSESASRLLVTVAPSNSARFESIMGDTGWARIGEVSGDGVLRVTGGPGPSIETSVAELSRAWKGGLE